MTDYSGDVERKVLESLLIEIGNVTSIIRNRLAELNNDHNTANDEEFLIGEGGGSIIVSSEEYARIIDRLENPKGPTKAMVELFRKHGYDMTDKTSKQTRLMQIVREMGHTDPEIARALAQAEARGAAQERARTDRLLGDGFDGETLQRMRELKVERDQLRRDLDHCRDQAGPDSCADMAARAVVAEGRVAELEKTLRLISNEKCETGLMKCPGCVVCIARLALGAHKEPTDDETPEQARVKFWLYFHAEYPDEGSVFPFASREEALAHAHDADPDAPWVILEREATDDEVLFIEFGAARERARIEAWHRVLGPPSAHTSGEGK